MDAVNGGMPPWFSVLMHPGAGLSKAEKAPLGWGVQATLAKSRQREEEAGSLRE